MKKVWLETVAQITENFDEVNQIKCPSCGANGIDYLYIGDGRTRIGFLMVWCNRCLKGINVSRAAAPPNAKFVTFEEDLEGIVPEIELN